MALRVFLRCGSVYGDVFGGDGDDGDGGDEDGGEGRASDLGIFLIFL